MTIKIHDESEETLEAFQAVEERLGQFCSRLVEIVEVELPDVWSDWDAYSQSLTEAWFKARSAIDAIDELRAAMQDASLCRELDKGIAGRTGDPSVKETNPPEKGSGEASQLGGESCR